MNRSRLLTVATAALLCLLTGLLSGASIAQTKISKAQLVGTWAYTSVVVERQDGSRIEPWGSKPVGSLIFTPNGLQGPAEGHARGVQGSGRGRPLAFRHVYGERSRRNVYPQRRGQFVLVG